MPWSRAAKTLRYRYEVYQSDVNFVVAQHNTPSLFRTGAEAVCSSDTAVKEAEGSTELFAKPKERMSRIRDEMWSS